MDTRKLIASGNAEEIRTEDGNMVFTTDNALVERPLLEKQAFVKEAVKRWNAYPKLVAALQRLESDLHDGSDADSDGYVIRQVREREGDYLTLLTDLGNTTEALLDELEETTVNLDPDQPEPSTGDAYTVVVRHCLEPHFRNFHVFATSPDMAGRVAIDSFIEADGLISDEDDGEDPDRFRHDYEVITIYAGHLTNLVQ